MPRGRLTRTRPPARAGFTLLEVLLSLAIGVVLLGALYVAVEVQLKHADAGRRLAEQSIVSRSLFNRFSLDIAAAGNFPEPARFRMQQQQQNQQGGQGGQGQQSAGGQQSANGQQNAQGQQSAGGQSATDPNAAGNANGAASGMTNAVTLPLSVMGDNQSLHLFISAVPRDIWPAQPGGDPPPNPSSDMRRVSYWLVEGRGLARQEVKPVTSDDAQQNLPPGIDGEEHYVIAEEVKSLQFSYYDGAGAVGGGWQDSWDSTTLGADGITPIGPPTAIQITIGLAPAGSGDLRPDDPAIKQYQHIVFLVTANGQPAANAQSANGQPAMNGQSANGGGSPP
jgi:prepilin-type N-terminal cleavage/methylation domain-containing protein